MIYLDYAANTPVLGEVLEVFNQVSREYIASPNSSHGPGRAARERLEACTRRILSNLGTPEHEIVYTSGATEANNLAIKGVAGALKNRGRHIISTYLEHASVNGALTYLESQGCEVSWLDLNPDGTVDLDHLKSLLRQDTILVTMSCVDSEIGLRQPIEEIGNLLADRPCLFHVDATQSVGKVPVCYEAADLITFSPHKFYGPGGCGALVKKPEVLLETQIHGGISTTPYRSGTPALALIAAADEALHLATRDQAEHFAYVQRLNERLRAEISRIRGVRINTTDKSSPYILNMSLPGAKLTDMLEYMEEGGVILSSKSACCAPNTISRPVYALTHDRKAAMSTLRVSLSHLTTQAEIGAFLERFEGCCRKFIP